MKTIRMNALLGLTAWLISLFLGSCSSGFKTDLGTGLKMVYKNLGVDDSYLTIDGAEITSNDIPSGKEVVVVLENVSGLKIQDGYYTILYQTNLTDAEGNTLLQLNDTLVEPKVQILRSYLTIGEPMVPGQTYHWVSRFTDMNGEGIVEAAVDLDVVE